MNNRGIIVGLLLGFSAVCIAQNPNAKTDINGLINKLKLEYVHSKEFDWDALSAQALETASSARNGGSAQAIVGLLEAINDPAMTLETRWTPAQSKQRAGIGELGLRADPDKGLIYEVFVGSAAEKEGIRLGDQLVSINGQLPQIQRDTVPSVGVVVPVSFMRGPRQLERSVTVFPLKSIDAPMHAGRLGRVAYLEPARAYPYGAVNRSRMASELQTQLRTLEMGAACGYMLDFRRVRDNLMPMIAGVGPILTSTNAPVFTEVHPNGSRDPVKYEPSTGFSMWKDEPEVSLYKTQPWRPKRPGAPIAVLTGPFGDGDSLPVAFAGRANTHFFGEAAVLPPFDYHYQDFSDGSWVRFPAGVTLDRLGHRYDVPLEMDEEVPTDWAVFGTKNDAVIQAARAWLESQPTCK
jgi:hypothetical protein